MTPALNALVLVAMIGLLAIQFIQAYANGTWRRFLLNTVAVIAFAVFLNFLFGFPLPAEGLAKGTADLSLAGILFGCMLLGMLAQALYQRFQLLRAVRLRTKFDWGLFFAPVCASPIVFTTVRLTKQRRLCSRTQLQAESSRRARPTACHRRAARHSRSRRESRTTSPLGSSVYATDGSGSRS
jgi:hypothetical protein